MKKPPTDVGASVRARLLGLAREQGEDFQLLLTRYANERLLFRLSASGHAQQFVLKGAALFALCTGKPHRTTRDLDLLGFGDPGVAHLREVFSKVLALDVVDDGVHVGKFPGNSKVPDRQYLGRMASLPEETDLFSCKPTRAKVSIMARTSSWPRM